MPKICWLSGMGGWQFYQYKTKFQMSGHEKFKLEFTTINDDCKLTSIKCRRKFNSIETSFISPNRLLTVSNENVEWLLFSGCYVKQENVYNEILQHGKRRKRLQIEPTYQLAPKLPLNVHT